MKKLSFILIAILFLSSFGAKAQTTEESFTIEKDTMKLPVNYPAPNPLAPAKAAFYSAILPGLGQAYNKKYWKIPIVYGGMGLSLYYYSFNNKKYHEYRDAYKLLLAGGQPGGELTGIDADRLIRAQKFHQKNRDLSMLITAGLYILQILEANVDAHLMQFNVNENLSLRPNLQQNEIDNKHNMGLKLSYQF
ncbi:hypothetical protein AMR72_06330 [Flavobacterium psychrophilum]|nr:hypothetical protein AMR72_06330 [Flavobacterium psychrophilum]AOE52165.1 hypothetical protein ALW18_06320 [Flavobacterium psychrophilum]